MSYSLPSIIARCTIVFAVAFGCPSAASAQQPPPIRVIDRIVAVVNDEVITRKRLRLARVLRIDQKRRQDSRYPSQIERGFGTGDPLERFGLERTLERIAEIERGIAQRARGLQIERVGPADQHRGMRLGRLALVDQLERGSARGGDQHRRRARAVRDRRFSREQDRPGLQLDRPAVAQRIDRLRAAA